jgi:hypothetical protein
MNLGGLHISRLVAAVVMAVSMLALPAQAGAAKAGVLGDTLAIAGGSESSTLTVTKSGNDLIVSDAALDLSEGDDCNRSGNSRKRISCPAQKVTKLVVVGLDGNDSLDVSSLSIGTTFYGGNGADVILARNGVVDAIHCGSGSDSGTVDAGDVLAADCESAVARPTANGAPAAVPQSPVTDPSADDPPAEEPVADDPTADEPVDEEPVDEEPAPDAAQAPVAIDTPSTIVLSSSGEIALGLTCTAESGDCTGSIEIVDVDGTLKTRTQTGAARRGKRAARKDQKAVVLGRARFSVAAGASEEVTVRLSRAGRQRIIKKKKRKTRARIVISVRSPDGTTSTTSRTITIAASRERRTSGRVKTPKPPKPTKSPRGGRAR